MRRFNLEGVFQLENSDIVITGRMDVGDIIKTNDLILIPDGGYLKVDKIQMFYKGSKIFYKGSKIGDNIGIHLTCSLGSGSYQPSKDHLETFLKTNLEIIDISEFREKKLKKLGI